MKRKASQISEFNGIQLIQQALEKVSDKGYSQKVTRFFKQKYIKPTSKFVGIRIPQVRAVIKECYPKTQLLDVSELLMDDRHEYRMTGLLLLVNAYFKDCHWELDQAKSKQSQLSEFYLSHIQHVNNWDLVDASAHVLGDWLIFDPQSVRSSLEIYKQLDGVVEFDDVEILKNMLSKLPDWYTEIANSNDLWKRRIAIVMLLHLKKDHTEFVLALMHYHLWKMSLEDHVLTLYDSTFDDHDLIHKAIGWVIRECGKSKKQMMVDFIQRFCSNMHKTTARYATEHLSSTLVKRYVSKAFK
ncbi:armadillo-type protein [Globomyces pollinis-pini]|nr:armadillo-type protein [Globomyces pollinis-pini]